MELFKSAGIPCTSTSYFPFIHPPQAGTHGTFVILHTPNGPIFSIGTQSIILALSFPFAFAKHPGV